MMKNTLSLLSLFCLYGLARGRGEVVCDRERDHYYWWWVIIISHLFIFLIILPSQDDQLGVFHLQI